MRTFNNNIPVKVNYRCLTMAKPHLIEMYKVKLRLPTVYFQTKDSKFSQYLQ